MLVHPHIHLQPADNPTSTSLSPVVPFPFSGPSSSMVSSLESESSRSSVKSTGLFGSCGIPDVCTVLGSSIIPSPSEATAAVQRVLSDTTGHVVSVDVLLPCLFIDLDLDLAWFLSELELEDGISSTLNSFPSFRYLPCAG